MLISIYRSSFSRSPASTSSCGARTYTAMRYRSLIFDTASLAGPMIWTSRFPRMRMRYLRMYSIACVRCASVSIHSEALSVIQDPAERAAAAFMTAARAIGEIRAMRCLTAFPAITSDEEEGRFLSAQAFAAALRTRFSEKDWEKLSDPDQLLESETRYRVPDSASNEPLFSGLEEGATRLPGFSRAFIQGSAGDTPFLAAGAVCGAFLISGEVTGNEKTCRKLLRDLGNETAFFVPLGFLYGRAGIRLDFLALAPDVFDIAEAYFSRHFRRGSVRFSRFRHRTSASSRSEPSQLPVEIYRQL